MKIGVATFGMPPVYNRKVGTVNGADSLERLLDKAGFDFPRKHITTPEDLDDAVKHFRSESVKCLVFNMRHWGRNSLMVQLARRMDLPLAFYCHTQNGLSGVTITTSVSGILREMNFSRNINTHERFTDREPAALIEWLKAVEVRSRLRESRIMCWGGSYGADMPYTRSDADALENFLIAEILTEPEKRLTDAAARIAEKTPERISNFLKWFTGCQGKIEYDQTMVTDYSIAKQVSLYFAARDRLAELAGENIAGVSIKCHFDLSICDWGCTACTLPAFLPYNEDSEGTRSIVPTACEGDVNGLIGLVLLHALNPDIPPLFGDLVEYKPEFVQLRNCGASSVFWAGLSVSNERNLAEVTLKANMHGTSGAAVSYETPAVDSVTLFRLFRLRGSFCAIYGRGKVLPEDEESTYADPWPHTRLDLGIDSELFFKVAPCNHASMTLGDYTGVIKRFLRMAGIRGYRCDSDEALRELERDILEI